MDDLRPAAFLDRDGVINYDTGHVGHYNEIQYKKGCFDAVRTLNAKGFRVFIITNQAGIGKGIYTLEVFKDCMKQMIIDFKKNKAHIDDIRYCPYHKDAILKEFIHHNHPWRKPNPGMINDLFLKWPTDKKNSFVVGDKTSDIEAAKNAGINGYIINDNDSLYELILKIPEFIGNSYE